MMPLGLLYSYCCMLLRCSDGVDIVKIIYARTSQDPMAKELVKIPWENFIFWHFILDVILDRMRGGVKDPYHKVLILIRLINVLLDLLFIISLLEVISPFTKIGKLNRRFEVHQVWVRGVQVLKRTIVELLYPYCSDLSNTKFTSGASSLVVFYLDCS